MATAVLIPWRDGCEHRRRALAWVLGRYAADHPDWDVHIGPHDDGPWCKADAVHAAIEQTEADTLVIADADVWCDNLTDTAAACTTWAVPHRRVHRFTEESTEQLYRTGQPGHDRTERPYIGHSGGGIVVIRRHIYIDCPLDPRFVGWGQEDDSWATALVTLHGRPWRAAADLWHLWHPPQPRESRRVGSTAGLGLAHRYRQSRSPVAMRALIEEAKHDNHRHRATPNHHR